MTNQQLFQPTPVRPQVPVGLAICFGGTWVAFALGETVIGELDALESAAALAADSGRVATAGLLHILAGVLLTLGLMGLWDQVRAKAVARIGALLCAALAPCLGAFGMLHLLALEMDDIALERLQGFGVWGVPVIVVALLGPFMLTVLLAGLARLGHIPWWAVALTGGGALLHLFGGALLDSFLGNGVSEIVSHWLIAGGMVTASVSLARR
jgi:hypothetical protein